MIGIKELGNAVKNLRVGTVGMIVAGVGLAVGAVAIALGNKNTDDPSTFIDTDVLEEPDTEVETVETPDVEVAVEE